MCMCDTLWCWLVELLGFVIQYTVHMSDSLSFVVRWLVHFIIIYPKTPNVQSEEWKKKKPSVSHSFAITTACV